MIERFFEITKVNGVLHSRCLWFSTYSSVGFFGWLDIARLALHFSLFKKL